VTGEVGAKIAGSLFRTERVGARGGQYGRVTGLMRGSFLQNLWQKAIFVVPALNGSIRSVKTSGFA